MAAKLQIEFQVTKSGFPRMICDKLSTLLKSKSDQIPPAYMCNKEKLVIIVFEKVTKDLKEYINSLDTNKTANICYISLTGEGCDELAAISESKGVKVVGKIGTGAKKGLFGIKMTEENMSSAIESLKTVVNGLFDSLKL